MKKEQPEWVILDEQLRKVSDFANLKSKLEHNNVNRGSFVSEGFDSK